MDLQFVNVSDPREIKSGDVRRLVRSQAMRSFRHRQRLELRTARSFRSRGAQPKQVLEDFEDPRRKLLELAQQASQCRHLEREDNENNNTNGNSTSTEIVKAPEANKFDLFPMSLPEKYIFKVFDHCRRPSLA